MGKCKYTNFFINTLFLEKKSYFCISKPETDGITGTSAYRHALETRYKQDVLGAVELDNERYKIDNISLDFEVNGKKIVYTCTCDVTFYAKVFGNTVPAAANSLKVTGSHTAKYGR